MVSSPRKNALKAAIAAYIEHLKEPVPRRGTCEDEDGTISPELRTVCRYGQEISDHPAIYQGVESWATVLWVREHVSVDGSGWGEQKLHLVYSEVENGALLSVAEIDVSHLRNAIEGNDATSKALASMLKDLGVLKTSDDSAR
ncbi:MULTISPECIES: hypothetical protein [Cyanophyceae]|uniref:Uncharacterized protein n=1 Tax=Leptolyngbya subtilissima DQ-A4 TaxID=2933933 RepID=A0ABV0KC45_9CYAN|nr:hypothetical protein [Nodosilinea sp. FACHB-141]MBD2115261.1 hypothetical protein [Nodosilinea sp. FACHB-141]